MLLKQIIKESLDEGGSPEEITNRIFTKLVPYLGSSSPFICGHAGKTDGMGLPEKLFVCPTYGLSGFSVYSKTEDYSEPGY